MQLSKIRGGTATDDDMPFLKRYASSDESEYRIIYPSSTDIAFKHLDIPLTAIRKTSVNPWASDTFFNIIRETIKNINGCEDIKVGKSSLIDNKEWRWIGDSII